LGLSLGSVCSWGAVTFNFNYLDVSGGTGIGFDDATQGSTYRGLLESVANSYLGTLLDHTATVDITVNASQTDGSGFLASAGSSYFTVPNSFQPGLVGQHIVTGVDPSLGNPDGSMTWDFGYTWGTGETVGGSEYDFRTVALHELTHALGFASGISSSGASVFGSNIYTYYDAFLVDGEGNALINEGTFVFQADAVDLTTQVGFAGAHAMAANGGEEVDVYTPATFASGSSLSHITAPNDVMLPSIGKGDSRRELTPRDIAILADMGYSFVANVPEAGSVAVCLGLGALMFGVWRKGGKANQ